MKRRIFTIATAALLVSSITFTSCIGPFNLSKKLLAWNHTIGNKFVNEIVFFAMWVVPVYEICMLADFLVLNSIEFWTGDNPVQAGIVKEVEGENGIYTVETLEDGYSITNEEGQTMSLLYNKESNVWSAKSGDKVVDLVKIEEDHAIVYMPNGTEQNVPLNADGVLAFRESVQNSMLYAAK